MIKMCKKHPRYKGIRRPKTCGDCYAFFLSKMIEEHKKTFTDPVDPSIEWVNGYPREKSTGLPCGRVFFNPKYNGM